MSKIKLSKDFILNTVKRALNEDLYPSGDITSSLVKDNKNIKELQLNRFDHYLVPVGHWHQISNLSNMKTHIIEIQYGEDCIESDIERLDKD